MIERWIKLHQIEYIGIIASLFIFLSFIFKNPNRIRIVNSVGSVLFIIYGILLKSYSISILNIATTLLQIYQLIKDKKTS